MLKLELRKKYKSGSAVEILCEAILAGEISGEISQSEFAESLGISRIPVREALITLEYQGLIEKLSNQHVKIINLNAKSIKNLFSDMYMLEFEIIKNFPEEKSGNLLLTENQMEFHRFLYENAASPLRKKFLEIITESYLIFILEHSGGERIKTEFENLKIALNKSDFNILKNAYVVYAEVLADELIRIRKERQEK